MINNANKHPKADPTARSKFVAPRPPRKSENVFPNPAPIVAPRKPVCYFFGSFFSTDIPANAPASITALSINPKTTKSNILNLYN